MDAGAKRYSLPKICHTYPTMMKLGTVIPYLKETQTVRKSHDNPIGFYRHERFFTRSHQYSLYQNIQSSIALG